MTKTPVCAQDQQIPSPSQLTRQMLSAWQSVAQGQTGWQRAVPLSALRLFITVCLRDHPEYLGLLRRPFYYAHLGGDLLTLSPLLSFYDGKLACRYLRQYIELGHEVMGTPLSASGNRGA